MAGHIGGSDVEASFDIATEGFGNCKAERFSFFRSREGKLSDLMKLRVGDLMRGWRDFDVIVVAASVDEPSDESEQKEPCHDTDLTPRQGALNPLNRLKPFDILGAAVLR